ncbi:MAG TPA: hypothetical protein VEX86_11745 [Longimicrobium sp.]|nr:hypothetical protein [Longimicrobium sp.]
MNRRFTALATLLCAAAALRAAPAAAQADTTTTATAPSDTLAPATPPPPATPAAAAAPAAPQQSVEDHAASRVPRARRSLNMISYEEVRNARVSDAFELIRNLRPSWLRTPRGPNSLSARVDVAVFKDGTRMGTRTALSSIPITTIRTVRFYTAIDARQKFGGDTAGGAIEITSH